MQVKTCVSLMSIIIDMEMDLPIDRPTGAERSLAVSVVPFAAFHLERSGAAPPCRAVSVVPFATFAGTLGN